MRSKFIIVRTLLILLSLAITTSVYGARKKNVIFIICDDLNDSLHGFGGHPQAYTPNIDRLANMGVRFVNAQSNAPMCSPSRPSLLSGLYPSSTGMYAGKPRFRTLPKLKEAVLFPTHFKEYGYDAYCAGKLFHGVDKDMTIFGASTPHGVDGGYLGPISNFGPYPWDGKTLKYGRPSRNCPNPDLSQTWTKYDAMKKPWALGHGRLSNLPEGMSWVYSDNGFEGIDGKNGGLFKYEGSQDRSPMPDELVADWAVKLLSGKETRSYAAGKATPLSKKPFLLTLGFIKTHFALYTPDEFYDAVLEANNMTEDDVLMPWTLDGKVQFDDLSDVAPQLKYGAGRSRYKILDRAAADHKGGLKQMLKGVTMSYLAAVYQIDVQVGKVLDALEQTGKINDTIIIFTSDHGYHHGDKENFFKYTLWEKSTRVPFIVYDPSGEFDGTRGKVCDAPVSLIDIYPTLNELCNLPQRTELEGHSIKPFLVDVDGQWSGPRVALSAIVGDQDKLHDPNCHKFAVRSKQWRYCVTPDGKEELYRHESDPFERKNLAHYPEYQQVKVTLHKELCKLSGRSDQYQNETRLSTFE
jgi:arylsulfatase A-like enzyme